MGMASQKVVLVSNPGSASRKYGLYRGDEVLAKLHFEYEGGKVVCTTSAGSQKVTEPVAIEQLDQSTELVVQHLQAAKVLTQADDIEAIAIRIVAPSGYFLQHRVVDDDAVQHLESLARLAPLHINVALKEIKKLRTQFPSAPLVAISDSKFHSTKPDYAWNYGISLRDADTYDIKRYGFHGLSMVAACKSLRRADKLATKTVIAHLGSGASVTAVHGGKSMDNTMGYSPLEGLVMATRSGTIDYSAIRALQISTGMSSTEIETYLNTNSGLLGLGGSSDLRELLQREEAGDEQAALALRTYVYGVQKGIAQMAAALGGIDALVFTGTVGERSAIIRKRVVARLHYLDFYLDESVNMACLNPSGIETVSKLAQSKPVYVVATDEATEIAYQAAELIS